MAFFISKFLNIKSRINQNDFTQDTFTEKGGNSLNINFSKETSCLPSNAKNYLKYIIQSPYDLALFTEHYLYKNENIMFSIAEFRLYKLNNRIFTFDEFQKEFESNRTKAIEKLFLYPHSRTVERALVIPLLKNKFTLNQLYNFQKENPLINSILAGKRLCQLP
ncbi:MAG TPA: hypothetical protein VK590_01505 [Saprospiraceae bacterium]|nr:hypothetical protein [Saprospiraceae bacterium]